MEETINIEQIFNILKKHLKLIGGLIIAGALVAFFITTFFMTPKYDATVQILVNRTEPTNNAGAAYNTQQADVQMINTYKDIIQNKIVLDPVRKEIAKKDNFIGTSDDLKGQISISNEENSQVFSVTVQDTNAYRAADIANSVADNFKNKIKKMMKVNNVTIVADAIAKPDAVSPNKKMNILVGLLIGAILGIAVAVAIEIFDKTVKGVDFLTDLGFSNLGMINHIDETKKSQGLFGQSAPRVRKHKI
ncbi:YveK family protein [Dellaglioa algida]|uniref:Capsular polysaccharide biosynthesis protein CpsC n=1 Tax=Dellaglioa algida TaxID=105612 RepID=A0A5C6MAF7_9LACO|nr:Wzz/FepE/Etk N-terminal domain-containing protein [Dellaglioa algida]MDK1717129.1 Wzz/FepE/Etk N-terminal domain-containing protein [Dellaglioa algida]MDK1722071.1 Wzz/FepE/Etk N-terminal domain-containing protein [Dellaglioa algida]MDK1723144.1 Wzz/FepE/Etk N-terminal domain-containing protein [Dellaglioa algida]MDK1739904.1 Wzz/FepE/Etk N-terminal domain-containing protein [Dellaglioa algida]TWW11183.1 chain-length determining protein [Dellaglioa algida]